MHCTYDLNLAIMKRKEVWQCQTLMLKVEGSDAVVVGSESFGADRRQTDAGDLIKKTKVTWADIVRKTSSVPTK